MNNGIIELQETSPDNWRARYQGNYGIYTVKIVLDKEKNTKKFSCSCPSDGYPCKHIPIIKKAVLERIAGDQESDAPDENAVAEVLKEVSQKGLYNFLVRQAKYNPELTSAVLLEFTQAKDKNVNPYAEIVRKGLQAVHYEYDDYYSEEAAEIEVLDQWLEKAEAHIEEKNYHEAVLISKACIEEYAAWLEKAGSDLSEYLDSEYQSMPFEILQKAAAQSADPDKEALFDYCFSEMTKQKYEDTEVFDEFNALLLYLAGEANIKPDVFIALQDKLLKKAKNSPYDFEKILSRKIQFYRNRKQPEKAWQIIEENLHIAGFREELIGKKIQDKQFSEAKTLIQDYIDEHQSDNYPYPERWNVMLLKIAQEEKDMPTVRVISLSFLKKYFKDEYFQLYKSTFTPAEWTGEFENLVRHYQKNGKGFSESAADLLAAEKDAEALMMYIKKHLTAPRLKQYYHIFADELPVETLDLFRTAVDRYAETNMGRGHYEYTISLLKLMTAVKGGKEAVKDMIRDYKIRYKTRKAMIEMLNNSGLQY